MGQQIAERNSYEIGKIFCFDSNSKSDVKEKISRPSRDIFENFSFTK